MTPPFQIDCHSGPGDGGVWLINARLTFRDGHMSADHVLLAEARAALLRAITRAAADGQAHGAGSVRIFVDAGDGRVTEIGSDGMQHHFPLQ